MSNEVKLKKKIGSLSIAKKTAIRKVLEELKILIPELIKQRTRLGAGLKGNLKKLERSTINQRKRYSDNLSQETSPSESNLTATGQLLDSLTGQIKSNSIIVSIKKGKRKGELSGAKSTLTNQQVREFVEKEREFLGLTDQERQELIDLAFEMIKEEITRSVKT